MVKRGVLFTVLLTLIACSVPAVTASAPAGGQGWLTINCNVDGASVYVDNTYKGMISGGSLDIENGAYGSSYTVEMDNYYPATGDINYVPGGEANIEIAVTLTPKPAGSGKGWITVHCDVDGASVAFDGVKKGTITDGIFTLEVSTTGTPYTTYAVSKSGYYAYTGSVTMPSDGMTTDLYPALNPIPVTAITTKSAPATISTPIGGSTGWYKIHCNVNGASVYLDNDYKGVISNGELSVKVYTTGTPYSKYLVSADGYVTVTGPVSSVPAAGQTRDIYVTLYPVVTTTTAAPVGSGTGTYAVQCNVDGAKVYFDDSYQGVISNGVLHVSVSTTGTPFSTYRVEKTGYTSVSGAITKYPAGGEIFTIQATLTKSAVTTMATTTSVPTTQSPLPLWVTLGAVIGAFACVSIAAGRHERR
ncbi:MAG TPA: hypothetical protein PKM50_02115 [Methanoregula sp.]|nr:hypothetical protein [Methanoregula sp.]